MTKPAWFHLTARAAPGTAPLLLRTRSVHSAAELRREGARALWHELRRSFPDVAACTLMPDHDHLLAHGIERDLSWRFSYVMNRWCDRLGWQRWEIGNPTHIPNFKHLLRQIRYVHLNPCRDGYCHDPLEWEWSTHRDWTGFVLVPWPQIGSLFPKLPIPRGDGGPAARFHRYVSSDPTVAVTGTQPPPIVRAGAVREFGREQIAGAVSAATRGTSGAAGTRGTQRDLLLAALARATSYRPAEIARWAGVAPSTVTRLLARRELSDTEWCVLQRVLHDARLARR